MLNFFSNKKLDDVLNETIKIKVKGINFKIRKINVLNYLEGSRVVRQIFDTYKTKGQQSQLDDVSEKQMKKHFCEVIVAGVVDPKISWDNKDPNAIHVDKLFFDWEIVNDLYTEIIEFTYGKKKANRFFSLEKS